MERMNKIEIDTANLMADAEAGVTLGRLTTAADEAGLSFPPHPGDESAQVGGLVATNAGGSRAVRHGVMRNHVRAIEVVLPTGEILNLGRKVHKNNVGYDLVQLIIGSEGTLAVITKATLQLYPKYGATATLILPYNSRREAISSVPKILRVGTPLAIEFVEKGLMESTAKRLGTRWPVTVGEFYLIVIVAESDRDMVLLQSQKIAYICKQSTIYEPYFAESEVDQDNILRIRSNIYSSLKSETVDILDITVPVATLENVVAQIDAIAQKYAVTLPVFGHAGDGNLHVHIMRNHSNDQTMRIRNEIYELATKAGGVITGEHGIGKIRTDKVQLLLSPKEIEIVQRIKKMLDPNGILNPGTKLPN
jgi:glycolate oxidase